MKHTRKETTYRSFSLNSSSLINDLSATPAPQDSVLQSDGSIPFDSAAGTQGCRFSHPPLLLDNAFESEFQSNLGVDSFSTASSEVIGLGILFAEALSTRSSATVTVDRTSPILEPPLEPQANNTADELLLRGYCSYTSSPVVALDSAVDYFASPECPAVSQRFSGISVFKEASLPAASASTAYEESNPISSQTVDFWMRISPSNAPKEDGSSPDVRIGLFPDINMFHLAKPTQEPSFGINPAQIMGDVHIEVQDTPTSPLSPASRWSPLPAPPDDVIPEGVVNDIVSIISASLKQEQEATKSLSPLALMLEQQIVPKDEVSIRVSAAHEPPINTVALSLPLLVLPEPPTRGTSDVSCGPSIKRKRGLVDHLQLVESESEAAAYQPSLDSPVLNAHQGVDVADLIQKAETYRILYGKEIDQDWLLKFVGKLSERGELLDDYRCYVLGCGQTNKRRDHIIVHIGSHVDRRPFACQLCSMRFLRKNECKRHEYSHSGDKPFSCDICSPFENRRFARQDLLKRHLKRRHGIESAGYGDKENRPRHRPYKRIKVE